MKIDEKHFKTLFIGAIISSCLSMFFGYQFGQRDLSKIDKVAYKHAYYFNFYQLKKFPNDEYHQEWLNEFGKHLTDEEKNIR